MMGCGRSTSKHPFRGGEFPTSCSDAKIEEQIDIKKEYYPIYVNYSPQNLEVISTKFCVSLMPPNRVFRRDVNKESVEVAFFNSLERANIFRQVISVRFPDAEVGSPITFQSVKDSMDIGTLQHFVKYQSPSISFPVIGENDLNQLKSLVGRKNRQSVNFQVALPTYIPDGFNMAKLRINNLNGFSYLITYEGKFENKTSCFNISGDGGGTGGFITFFTSLNINSIALGNIQLDYSSFDKVSDISNINFNKNVPAIKSATSNHYSMASCKDGVSLSESIKIIESIRFLRP
jgi:hypothetical protein